ncbi:sugar-binding transcriptional regulator [Paramicrobacterium agarici]|uniref:Deoxyribonucleoside regulator n=1 Tax=Paramicrobacterium agarici TaxID=630514 RepID=A0A2A9DWM7_9MICO|nr:sugar-binding domain-containing protein [Microbacterium agarici]PFG30984.1 deoxyribonucleoside regulator [Microbacterium agarici]TQO24048.1 deoxyribonucleoside regulator [Microbacterium agarici]
MPRTDTADDELLSIRAAELYYDEGKTQDEVGAILGLTRWKVGRLLAAARENGYIRIEIVHPRARKLSLERQLREQHGLTDAVVVPVAGARSDAELRERVAQGAADYLAALRPVPRTLGISWGRTLHDVANVLNEHWAIGVNVVQVNGGVSVNQRAGTAAATAVEIARKASGEATLLPSPAILERVETKTSIENDRTVAAVLDEAADAAAYLFSAGPADHSSAHIQSGYLSTGDMDELVRRGAVGDVWGRYINAEGMIVDPSLDQRTLGLGLTALREAQTAILVVSGESKHPVTRAIVRNGLCSALVTDEATARDLLSETIDQSRNDKDSHD